jgi:hypothetical protein
MEWNEEEQAMCEGENEIYSLLNDCSHYISNVPIEFDPRDRHECYFGDLNWNNMIGARNGEFEGHHIGYAMHELYDHSCWGLPDIVRINRFDATVRVEYQHYCTERAVKIQRSEKRVLLKKIVKHEKKCHHHVLALRDITFTIKIDELLCCQS